MIPFAIPLALKALPWKWIGVGVAAIAVLLAVWWVVDSIGDSREEKVRAEYEAAQRAAEAKAAADTKLLQDAIAEIDTGITIDMEAINAVRTVYRDRVRTVAVDRYRDRDCSLPDGLLGEVNAAAKGFAAAATGPGGPAVRPAEPTP
jgi:hypothetical protein